MTISPGAVRIGLFALMFSWCASPALAQDAKDEKKEPTPVEAAQKTAGDAAAKAGTAVQRGDSAWMLISTALVMLMVPGLALFYAGMVRRKNVLATMMQSMVALAVVGVYWVAIGYCLAFGNSQGGIIGFNPKLIFLNGIESSHYLPGYDIPVYLHVMFQGMFAIITPALISGAFAERIRFGPYLLFMLVWVTFIYCPLAHMVWAANFWAPDGTLNVAEGAGTVMVGFLGKSTADGGFGALDFAGGTVVHIAAGFSALAGIFALRKRKGYPEQAIHPNSMVLCLTGAALLWFGWFGFNGGSALNSSNLAVSAFAATQIAAAAGALSWMLAEWLHKGKPTALGFASGLVAGLVAVTPASGFVYITGGLVIGLVAGVLCYLVVSMKPKFGYDDSLDVFGVHGIGGFVGAVLTGVFCYTAINSVGTNGLTASFYGVEGAGVGQLIGQIKAAVVSAVLAFVGGYVIVKVIDVAIGFTTDAESEIIGLDQTEHGESGFDFGPEMSTALGVEPRPAKLPPGGKRFTVVVDGVTNGELLTAWSEMCQPGKAPDPAAFKGVYPFMTTVTGNRFNFRGGDPETIKSNLQRLFAGTLRKNVSLTVQ